MAPRTSFLIPVRDGASTVDEAVRSALHQTDGDLEVVVVDDGSTDDTGAVVSAIDDPRVRLLALPPTGLPGALNHGLAHCRGRYVARLDSDDRAHPERLARQLPLLDADPTLAVVDGQVRFFRDDEPVPEGMTRYGEWISSILEPEDFDRELLIDSPVVHPAATIRADALRAVDGYRDGPFPEDYDLWLRLHAAGWRFRKAPSVLVEMRDRPARLTRTDPRYGRPGFRLVRQAWLSATVLADPRRVVLIGGGRTCRPWLRWLLEQGHTVVGIVDVARHGHTRHGVPVLPSEAMATVDAELGLVTVGSRDARPRLRAYMAAERPDWAEGRHWWLLT